MRQHIDRTPAGTAARTPRRVLVVALFALGASALPAAAQQPDAPARRSLAPALGVHLGFSSIENADNALEYGLFADVGSYRKPRLRVILGLDYLSSSSQRPGADGDFRDVTLNGDIRYKPFRLGGTTPYIGGGLGLHVRSTSSTEPNVRDLYNGVAVGVQGFVGAMRDASETGRWGLLGELRRVQAQNISRTSLRVGSYWRL